MRRVHVLPLHGFGGVTEVAARLGDRPNLAWLDGDGAGERGRYAFVGSDPVEVRRHRLADGALNALWAGVGAVEGDATAARSSDHALHGGPPSHRVPAWAGYVAYDATWAGSTRTPPAHVRPADTTVAWLGRYDAWAAFDLQAGHAWLVGDDAEACARLRARIAGGNPVPPTAHPLASPTVEPPEPHLAAIRHALERIFAGDVYQVNLARHWTVPLAGHALALMGAMRRRSPVPLGFYLDDGERTVVSRTMETFLEQDAVGGPIATRPIKGTTARTGGDAQEASALRADPKERAEHAMIVDLLRNDLGRIAMVGTVEVAELMAVEPFAGLHHLVSTVTCTPRPDVGLAEIFAATFPPGSVTGAPKARAVGIIEALEPSPRGVYCGAIGHVSRTGGVRFAVAIRTAIVEGGIATYHAGGGIVEASDPARELAETELKARVFLDAVGDLEG
jgi:anthranilate/para-aminobenzoate synthase component I